jgi:integrase
VALLAGIYSFSGTGEYVFPGRGGKRPISEMTLSTAFQRMGIDTKTEATPHGWRATARTLLAERLKFEPRIIELQLAHSVPDSLGRAYNRALFVDDRIQMMQVWADYLDTLK